MFEGKRPLFLALFLLSIFLFSSCTHKKLDNAVHLVIFENPKSLDPVSSSDALAAEAISPVYETFLQYHYFKRPYELTPLLAEEMPSYSKDGLLVTIKLKHGVMFQDDPCFKDGKGRELTAQDFIFGFKRLADPKNKSDGWWVLDQKIVGLNEWRDLNSGKEKTDYTSQILGLTAPDKYTLQIKLKKKYPQLNHVLAMVYTSPMPFEAVEKYGPEISNHPVGTGAFVITEYVRNSHITFEKNKNFHTENFPTPEIPRIPSSECAKPVKPTPVPKKINLETCKTDVAGRKDPKNINGINPSPSAFSELDYGKALPLSDKIVLHISLERQPAWLEFMSGHIDKIVIPKDNYTSAINENHELKVPLREKGMKLSKDESTTEWYLGFNMDDPIVGKNKNLRKAIGLAYDSRRDIDLFTNGVAKPFNQILPPSIAGFDQKIQAREINLEKAKKYLAAAGYPGGKGLEPLTFDIEGSSIDRQRGEFFKSQMAQIGIQVTVRVNTRPELLDRKRKGKLQVHLDGWIADYPDAENFMQLLYGPNRPPGPNNSSFNNAEFNSLYEKMAGLEPSRERQKLIDRMTEIFLEESPWIPNWVATLYHVHQAWLKNYIYSDFSYNNYKYYRVDLDEKREQLKQF